MALQRGHHKNRLLMCKLSNPRNIPQPTAQGAIKVVLDHQRVPTRSGIYQKSLAKWNGQPVSDSNCKTTKDSQ